LTSAALQRYAAAVTRSRLPKLMAAMGKKWISTWGLAMVALGTAVFLGTRALPTTGHAPGRGPMPRDPSDASAGPAFMPHGELTDEQSVGRYTVRTYRSMAEGDGSFQVLEAGRRIYGQDGWCFGIGDYFGPDTGADTDLVGRDLTGNGKLNLVMEEWTGGAHCDFIAYVLEIGDGCRLVAQIDGRHSTPVFRDLDNDSIPEVLVNDWTFAYWPTCFATSPAPRVVLRWSGREYQVAADLMWSPAPADGEFAARAALVCDSPHWGKRYSRNGIPMDLFSYALDLMYAGHEDLGWRFIETAWPERFPRDTELLDEFRRHLASSEYWPAVREYAERRRRAAP